MRRNFPQRDTLLKCILITFALMITISLSSHPPITNLKSLTLFFVASSLPHGYPTILGLDDSALLAVSSFFLRS